MTKLDFESLSKQRLSLSSTIENITSPRKKRRSGCASCLMGCLGLMLLVCALFAGIFLFIYTMDKDEALGGIAVRLLKNQSININLTADIYQNNNIPFDEKTAIKISYDKFLADYDSMPKEKQKKIKKNFGILIKKFIHNPAFLKTEPVPAELKELVAILVPEQPSLKINETQIPVEEKIEEKVPVDQLSEEKILETDHQEIVKKEIKKIKKRRKKR
ncbi:MAG: hypothetical protein HQM16_08320 [Deltaproteobacteria bacterium]|nr:hypothetical protein [Deltaproteobacteria bacterium]